MGFLLFENIRLDVSQLIRDQNLDLYGQKLKYGQENNKLEFPRALRIIKNVSILKTTSCI